MRTQVITLVLGASLVAGCGSATSSQSVEGKLRVVAAENFWASIVSQVGGDRVQVTAIIANPDTDPHDYEPTAADARAFAAARYVVVNGAGYDSWASKLLGPGATGARKVLTVADLAGRKPGDNPHMWYDPAVVLSVVDRVASDLESIDPADARYFAQQATTLKATGFRQYDDLRTRIRTRFADVPIGSTEAIFEDLARDLALDDVTPADFQRSMSEGIDLSPPDRAKVEQQIARHEIEVLVFNEQNATPDVQSLVGKANAVGIPVVAITETLDPATASFQDWQSAQLTSLEQALAEATGR